MAGKQVVNKHPAGWVRPVSDRPSSELRAAECCYGTAAQKVAVGDVFCIALAGTKPHAYQPENELIDTEYHCRFEKKATWVQLATCVDATPGPIWLNGYETRYGSNDKLPSNLAPALNESLKLVRVHDLEIIIAHEWPEIGNKRTLRGAFTVSNHSYTLKITDPNIHVEFEEAADGRYQVGEAMLCISLGEPYKEDAYKLIASIIRKGFHGIV